MDFAVPAEQKVKLKESKKRAMYLDLSRELKKIMEHECDGDTSCNWHSRFCREMIATGTSGHEVRGWVETIQTTALLRSAVEYLARLGTVQDI